MKQKSNSAIQPKNNNVEDAEHITRIIENGQYYKNARDWYSQIFLYPSIERSMLLLICIVSSLSAFIMYSSVRSLYPLSTQIPFAVFASWNSDEYYPELRKLADQMVDSERILREYFLINYVKDREEYVPPVDDTKIKANQNRKTRVLAQSNKRVRRTYDDYIDIYNSNGPYMIYGYHTTREVIDESIAISYNAETPNRAIIRFQTKESRNNQSKKSNWQASITFSISDLDLVLRDKGELKLTVSEYDVIRLQ